MLAAKQMTFGLASIELLKAEYYSPYLIAGGRHSELISSLSKVINR